MFLINNSSFFRYHPISRVIYIKFSQKELLNLLSLIPLRSFSLTPPQSGFRHTSKTWSTPVSSICKCNGQFSVLIPGKLPAASVIVHHLSSSFTPVPLLNSNAAQSLGFPPTSLVSIPCCPGFLSQTYQHYSSLRPILLPLLSSTAV